MKKIRVLVTCGPTWVPIDDVRVISNISTGEMGHLITQEFHRAQVRVTLLEGPVVCPLVLKGVRVIKYRFLNEFAALFKHELQKQYDIVVHSAAVSDFKLTKTSPRKIDSHRGLSLRLIPAEKLIQHVKHVSPQSCLVGFKLESRLEGADLRIRTRELLKDSRCDVVVANTFHPSYRSFILDADGNVLSTHVTKKKTAAHLVKMLI